MKKHLQFNEGKNIYQGAEIIINKKDIKNLIIKVNKKNEIVVSVPKKIDDDTIKKFINTHIDKLKKYVAEMENKKSFFENEKSFYLFGHKINYEIDKEKQKIIIQNKKYSLKSKNIKEVIDTFKKDQLKVYILVRQLQLQKLMNIADHKIRIRNKTTAWATNYTKQQIIYYSINLASFSKEIIDYVIIHELAHHKFANHSKDFWNIVEMFEPDYKNKRLKLKKSIYY